MHEKQLDYQNMYIVFFNMEYSQHAVPRGKESASRRRHGYGFQQQKHKRVSSLLPDVEMTDDF